jgi:CRP-like cAMP-binding protein
MFEHFLHYITQYSKTSLSDEHIAKLRSAFLPISLKKREYLVQEGGVCKQMGFIVKGAMRQYSVDEKGVEYIVNLSIENWWAGDRESWVMLTPSLYNIDAWEDTEMLTITRADFLELLQHVPVLHEVIKSMDEKHAIAIQRRLTASISFPAEQRYTELEKTYPQFLKRFPQHIIASYLGITKETLSRIRHRLSKR